MSVNIVNITFRPSSTVILKRIKKYPNVPKVNAVASHIYGMSHALVPNIMSHALVPNTMSRALGPNMRS